MNIRKQKSLNIIIEAHHVNIPIFILKKKECSVYLKKRMLNFSFILNFFSAKFFLKLCFFLYGFLEKNAITEL